MWSYASNAIAGSIGGRNVSSKPSEAGPDCSDDDDISSCTSREEGLECPICCESFNIVENVPYVLWCGHTLCKNCIMGLRWAVVKFPNLPIQLPLFISCPWCHSLSFRVVYKGNMRFPRKNYFLLWMVEGMNGGRGRTYRSVRADNQPAQASNSAVLMEIEHDPRADPGRSYLSAERIHSSFHKSLVFFVHLTSKFPLVLIFLIIVVYAVPASAAILALYILITLLFALPSLLMLYFAYASLDWLVREIMN